MHHNEHLMALSSSEPASKVNLEKERERQSFPKSGVKLLFCVVGVVAVLLAAVAAAVPRMERWPQQLPVTAQTAVRLIPSSRITRVNELITLVIPNSINDQVLAYNFYMLNIQYAQLLT